MRALLVLVFAVLSACSTVHGVRPIGAGAIELEATVGGPVVELFGGPKPMPITTVGATVGLDDRTDVHASIHPTGLALFGLFAADAGVARQFVAPDGARPRLMADLTLMGAAGNVAEGEPEGGFRAFVRPTVTASWDWGKHDRSTVYAALGGFVQPWPGPHGLGTVAVGNLWALGKHHLTTQVEWIAPYASSYELAPEYHAPGNLGAVSVQLGFAARVKGGQ